MTDISQNGWTVIESRDSTHLHNWLIGARSGPLNLLLHRGPAGFLLAHYALWHAEEIEAVAGKGDDFGWAFREILNTNTWSNHASGTAMDLNASKHPSRVSGTFTATQADRIRKRIAGMYAETLQWGGNWKPENLDEMHFEINADRADVRAVCDILVDTPRGVRLLADNPSQRQLIQ